MGLPYSNNPTTHIDIPWLTLITRVDPDFTRDRRRELTYDFSPKGRRFYADPAYEGPYGGSFDLSFDASFDSPFADKG